MDGVEPRGVGATRVVLAGVFVCSAASCRRLYILIYILIRFVNCRLSHPHIALTCRKLRSDRLVGP